MLNNWKYINRDKFHFDFVTLSKVLDIETELCEQGSRVYHISCYAEENLEQFKKELREILEESYDVIHIHTNYWRGFAVEKIAKEMGVPKIIIHSHNTGIHNVGRRAEFESDADQKRAIESHLQYRSMLTPDMATDFWACSNAAAGWLFGNQIPKDRINILYNAVDIDKFTYREEIRKQYRKELGVENYYVMGHVGRFTSQKNHAFLMDIMKNILTDHEHVRLISVGWGELKEKILVKAIEYGISDKIIFLERRNDVNKLMQAMDLFLLPSLYEGFPIVLVEAQAEGIPCIISDNITNEVCITPNVTRLPLEMDSWIRAIEYAIEQGESLNRKDSVHLIEQTDYNILNQIKKLEHMYCL